MDDFLVRLERYLENPPPLERFVVKSRWGWNSQWQDVSEPLHEANARHILQAWRRASYDNHIYDCTMVRVKP